MKFGKLEINFPETYFKNLEHKTCINRDTVTDYEISREYSVQMQNGDWLDIEDDTEFLVQESLEVGDDHAEWFQFESKEEACHLILENKNHVQMMSLYSKDGIFIKAFLRLFADEDYKNLQIDAALCIYPHDDVLKRFKELFNYSERGYDKQ